MLYLPYTYFKNKGLIKELSGTSLEIFETQEIKMI